MKVPTDPRKDLVGEIFDLTGQKVGIDDPIVTAALVNSTLIRQAGEDAMFSIQSGIDLALIELKNAVKEERKAAADISKATDLAYQQIMLMTKSATKSEVHVMRSQFYDVLKETLGRMHSDATPPFRWKIQVGILAMAVILLSGAAGVAISQTWLSKDRPSTAEQTQHLTIGKRLIEILPQLDKTTKDKLLHLLEKNK